MSNLRVKLLLEAIDRISAPIKSMSARVRGSVGQISAKVNQLGAAFKNVGRSATDLGKGMATKLSLPLIGLGTLAVRKAAQFEDFSASLETATGSAEKARETFDRLMAFTASTPYQLDEVMGGFIKLKNLGLEPTEAALTSYGNTASAMGKSLDQFIEAVADASTNEFERLKEFGIKARQEGENVAFTFQGNTTVVRKNAEEIEGYLRSIGNDNFAGSMEKRMRGLNGVFSNFSDTISTVLAAFGNDVSETLNIKKITTDLAESLQALLDKFQSLPKGMQEFIIKAALVTALIGPLIAGFGQFVFGLGMTVLGMKHVVGAAVLLGRGAIIPLIGMIAAATKGIIAMGVAFMATPIGWITAAIVALIAVGFLLVKNWDKVKAGWNILWAGMKDTVDSVIAHIRPLIDWMSNALDRVVGGLSKATNFVTDNPITRGVRNLVSNEGAPATDAAVAAASPARQHMNTGGTLNIKIDSEGKASVIRSRPADSRMRFAVDTGMIMGGAM